MTPDQGYRVGAEALEVFVAAKILESVAPCEPVHYLGAAADHVAWFLVASP